ncbi:pimeloyl-[acyl-carrier protein] methyl ester esterase [Vibrio sp. 10N.286.49.B3]|nr:pimeloyl-[acyl-carrier protein] methyl ester esterase [Vibrio sp. 10N.286.49.B3]
MVLLHGWGMNGAVWQQTVASLAKHYCVHVVDLPGYGHSAQAHDETLHSESDSEQVLLTLADQVLEHAPEQAIWVGWSLGGLVATHIALHHPQRVSQLVTVASSPCFAAQKGWRGIQPQVLSAFTEQLMDNFQLTVERFMALQAMGSPSARQDVKQLKEAVLSRPLPNQNALLQGLGLLANIDLRAQLNQLSMPLLRCYGRLDGLVPVKVATTLSQWHESSDTHIFHDSSHAPFMTQADDFCQLLCNL